jgi:outer membrane protein assembly factor BamB
VTAEPTPTVSLTPASPPSLEPVKSVRLWPAVTAVGLYWTVGLVVRLLDTFYFVGFLSSLVGSALLALFFLVWWWTYRSIPFRTRVYGFVLIVAGSLIMVPLCDASIGWWGLLLFALPIVLTVWVLWMIVAKMLCPFWQWAGSASIVVLTFASFTLIRIHGLDASLRSDIRWRWIPTAEELFLAGKNRATADQASSNAGVTVSLRPGDWPEFRGPNRDGVIHGSMVSSDWNTAPPRLVWRQRLGPGWSSVIVVDGRLYTQEQRGEQEAVVCYDVQTGKELWMHSDATRFWESVSGAGPRATPTFADGRIYALGGTGILNCLDAATGAQYWSHDIAAVAGTSPPQWGYSSSPLVADGLVIVFAGGEGDQNLLGYRADTGKLAWTALAGGNTYSSPQLATLAGQRQCLILTDHGLSSVDPATGAVLWKGGSIMPGAPRCVQPHVVGEAQLLVGTYDGASSTLVELNRSGDNWKVEPRWTSRDLKPEFPDFVVHQGHAYGFDVSMFCCIELASGKRCWKEGRYGRGQVVLLADQGLLLVSSETGEAVLLAADPNRHEELGRFQALDGKTWSHPVIAHGRLYMRNAEEIACYEVAPVSAHRR